MIDATPAAIEHCTALVRDRDHDRYLSALFAPAEHRPGLLAIRAFAVEVARIPELVSDPLPGEVRLQWWRDVLQPPSSAPAPASGPVAEALLATVVRYHLPVQAFLDVLEGRTFDLYDDPMPTVAALEGYCGETRSSLIRLETLVLADGGEHGPADAAGHAGVAEALVSIIAAAPHERVRGRSMIPTEILERYPGEDLSPALRDLADLARRHVAQARAALRDAPSTIHPAFLTLALVEPQLDAVKRAAQLSALRRQWLLWRAARKSPASR